MVGWVKTIQYGNVSSPIPAERWPWHWTYALFLEKRWEQVQEISAMYGDEDKPEGTYEREIPKEFWHDQRRVDEWIEKAKQRRKEKTP